MIRKKISLLIFVVLLFLTGIFFLQNRSSNGVTVPNQIPSWEGGNIGEDLPVSRCAAAKMISLAFFSPAEIQSMETVITFQDVSKDEWYFPYINAAVKGGYMQNGEYFHPEEPVSLSQAQILLDRIHPRNRTKMKQTDETKDKAISYLLWMQLFTKGLAEAKDTHSLGTGYGLWDEEIVIFASPGNAASLSPWTVATDKGQYGFAGYSVDGYMDKKCKVLVKEKEIVGFLEITQTEYTLENVVVSQVKDGTVSIVLANCQREFPLAQELSSPFGNASFKNGILQSIDCITDVQDGIIRKVDSTGVSLKESGFLPFAENCQLWDKNAPGYRSKEISDLICGTTAGEYYLSQGKIVAVLVERPALETVRVAISNSTGSFIQDSVSITSDSSFYVENGESRTTLQPGETATFTKDTIANGWITVATENNAGTLTLSSIQKAAGRSPAYRGMLDIEKKEEGFTIINQLPIEEYLYSVVPSEMPDAYGVEAAKLQAIAARSYAYNQFYGNSRREWGANMDDTVQCQVYQNIPETETSKQAVDATKGVCLTYEHAVINANFFSTSGGTTANSGEVWADNNQFPAATKPYLTAQKQYTSGDYGPFWEESKASAFWKENNVEAYDKESGWFRWRITLSQEELSAGVNANCKTVYERNPELLLTKQKDGSFRSMPIESVGTILDLAVTKRGEGGNAMELRIRGDQKELLVKTEYAIRTILAPVQQLAGYPPIRILCHNGTIMENYSLLPSAFFVLDKTFGEYGTLTFATFYGGGNGHGVGMSQNGARGMLQAGYSIEEIFAHYFPGTGLAKVLQE